VEYRDVKKEIVQRRRERIEVEGPALGYNVPRERKVPLIPFTREPLIICELKRRSPSKGAINSDLKALEQAALYESAGIQSISVLTEEDYFQGSLSSSICFEKGFFVSS